MNALYTKDELVAFSSENKENKSLSSRLRSFLYNICLYDSYDMGRILKEMHTSAEVEDGEILTCLTCDLQEVPLFLVDKHASPIAKWRLHIGR